MILHSLHENCNCTWTTHKDCKENYRYTVHCLPAGLATDAVLSTVTVDWLVGLDYITTNTIISICALHSE